MRVKELRTFVLGGLEQRPKLNTCRYCSKPALKITCGGSDCRKQQRQDYHKRQRLKANNKAKAANA